MQPSAYITPGLDHDKKTHMIHFIASNIEAESPVVCINKICKAFDRDYKDVLSKSRENPLPIIRHTSAVIIKIKFNLNREQTMALLNRCGSTYHNSHKIFLNFWDTDTAFREKLFNLK